LAAKIGKTINAGEVCMKTALLDLLICPACLPDERGLNETINTAAGEDILDGELQCPRCGRVYRIRDGIADLDPNGSGSANPAVRMPAEVLTISWPSWPMTGTS
jgi:uncharacterized protein YbaR (Trm112 family)